jgi:hypothetical protein
MLRTQTEKVLKEFANSVFLEAERNLPAFSGELKNSFKSTIKENPNSITLAMSMADYGFYQDEGVRGVGGVRRTTSRFNKSNNKGKMWKQKGKGSRFSFKKLSINLYGNGKWSGIRLWAISKGLNPYAVAKSVAMQGIKPSKFMTKALEKEFKTLPDEIVQAYGLDIDKFLAFAFKDNIKSIK